MEVKAKLSHLRISPRKVRLVADTLRGLEVTVALAQLTVMNKHAAGPMLKLLQSAVANAENNFKLNRENLYIAEIRVDEGPTLKRWTPRAFGRASAITKRTSHILIKLDERVKSEKPGKEKTKESKKSHQDVKIVEQLSDIKKMGKTEKVKNSDEKVEDQNKIKEIEETRSEMNNRGQFDADKIRNKSKGGKKGIFHRKAM